MKSGQSAPREITANLLNLTSMSFLGWRDLCQYRHVAKGCEGRAQLKSEFITNHGQRQQPCDWIVKGAHRQMSYCTLKQTSQSQKQQPAYKLKCIHAWHDGVKTLAHFGDDGACCVCCLPDAAQVDPTCDFLWPGDTTWFAHMCEQSQLALSVGLQSCVPKSDLGNPSHSPRARASSPSSCPHQQLMSNLHHPLHSCPALRAEFLLTSSPLITEPLCFFLATMVTPLRHILDMLAILNHTLMSTGANRFERSFLCTHRKLISTMGTTWAAVGHGAWVQLAEG